MTFSSHWFNMFARRIFVAFFLLAGTVVQAAEIHGVVADASGAKISGAKVVLLRNGRPVTAGVSGADGSFQITTGDQGRFYLVISATGFRQLETPNFYAGQFDNVEQNLVLEPSWVRESIVVTANGTPTPEPQTGAAISVLGPSDLAGRTDMVSSLRLMPGTSVIQTGQLGAQASLFIRGGDSDANKVLLDGVSAGDLGGRFDFGPLATTAIERTEVYRGPDSSLYGADAESGVVSLTTPHGTTSFPSFLFHGDAGNFLTSNEDLEVAGAHNKFDYLGEFSWLQTNNNLPLDEFHVATAAGESRMAAERINANSRNPPLWCRRHGRTGTLALLSSREQRHPKRSGSFRSAPRSKIKRPRLSITQCATALTRKREQYHLWSQNGSGLFDQFGDSFGDPVTITGANGYSVSGPALLDFAGTYPQETQLVSNRDQLVYQGDYTVTPHLAAQIGFQFEDERGSEPGSTFYAPVERTNYDYRAAVHGDFKTRFFYTLGGDLERYSLFGTQTTPRAGVSFYAMKPHKGIFSGTRILFNYGDAVREPSLTDQFYSLYSFLESNGGQSTVQQLGIKPLSAPQRALTKVESNRRF